MGSGRTLIFRGELLRLMMTAAIPTMTLSTAAAFAAVLM